jgi:cytochrome c-type biogenesis protein
MILAVAQSVGLLTAFGAGLFSFLTPCVLPLVPAYIANIAGAAAIETGTRASRWPALFHSLCFVAGFALVMIFLGVGVGFLGQAAMLPPDVIRYVAGSLVLLFGLYILAAWKVPWLNYEKRLNIKVSQKTGYLRSGIVGVAFSLGASPCVTPIQGAIMALAWSSKDVVLSIVLMAVYALGLGVPFILIGLLWGFIMPVWKSINKYLGIISLVSGVLLVIVGFMLLTDTFKLLSGWLQLIFPATPGS